MTSARSPYQRRNDRAKREGYRSYWHKRQTLKQAKSYQLGERQKFIRKSKKNPSAQWRKLYAQGDAALRRKDHKEADRIARQLGYRSNPDEGPARRLFYYH